jgi:hypothetical protein
MLGSAFRFWLFENLVVPWYQSTGLWHVEQIGACLMNKVIGVFVFH